MAEAHRKIERIRPVYERVKAEFEAAQREFKLAEQSFDIGERVEVEETCRRGCCVEFKATGVVAENVDGKDGLFNIKLDDGKIYPDVWHGKIRRIT